jgi:Tol biopolymer transport system component
VGEPPFTGSTPQAVLGKIVTGEAPSASAGRKSVPPNVDAAIRKALEKVPADRFAAVQDLGKALGDPGFHHGEAAVAVAPPQVASRRRLMMLGWGVAAVLAVGWVWSTMRGSPTQPIVRFEVPLPQGWIRATTSGKTVDISPDGTSIVFVAVQPGEGSGLWIRRLGQLAAVPIPGTEGGANPRFSPDGGSVSFSRGGRLLTVALGGGEPRTLVPDSVPLVGGAAWAPDGTLYFTRSSGEIWRVSETGAGLSRVTTLADGDIGHFSPDVLPEGESLLFTQLRGEFLGENQLAVLSLETGELKSLGVQSDMGRVSPTGHLVFPARQGAAGGLVDLMAAPFDLDRLEVTGPEQVVAERIGVTATSSSSFAVSSTGVLVYEPGNLEAGLIPVWVDRDGAQEPLDPGLPVGQYNTPSISPDGSKVAIAYSPNATAIGQIWLYDIDQGGTFVPFATDAFNAVPFWSPDGREVGFLSDRGSPGFNGIYAAPWGDGAQARLVRPARGQSIWDAAWMPDGQVVHRQGTRAVGQRTGIYVGPPDPDAALVTVVETDATESSPTVSPDGRWLAYEADQTGRFEVYVRPLSGPGASTQVSLDGAIRPLWSHGGSEIFFWTNDSVAVARVRTEPSFAVESRETLFSLTDLSRPTAQRPYDVAPDDSRLLMLRRVTAPGESAPYAVILNFAAELEGDGG